MLALQSNQVPFIDMMPVKPERKTQLEEFARKQGLDAVVVLDNAIEAYIADEQDYNETVQAALEGYEDVKAGRTQPLQEVLAELRAEYGFPH